VIIAAVALMATAVSLEREDICKSIEAWTNDAQGKEVKMMQAGLITKEFD